MNESLNHYRLYRKCTILIHIHLKKNFPSWKKQEPQIVEDRIEISKMNLGLRWRGSRIFFRIFFWKFLLQNFLIAREVLKENLLMSFLDYLDFFWKKILYSSSKNITYNLSFIQMHLKRKINFNIFSLLSDSKCYIKK